MGSQQYPKGWYTDPNTGSMRWWDGARWGITADEYRHRQEAGRSAPPGPGPRPVPNPGMRPPAARRRHTKRNILITVIAVICVIALVIVGIVVWRNATLVSSGSKLTKEQAYGDYFDADVYDLQEPMSGVGYDGYINLEADPSIIANKDYDDNDPEEYLSTFVRVYVNPALTMPAQTVMDFSDGTQASGGKPAIRIGGHMLANRTDVKDDYSGTRPADYGWTGYDGYWMVQYKDTRTGKALKKPKVTYFTVNELRRFTSDLPAPTNVTLGMDKTTGALTIDWDDVEGASKYVVSLVTAGRENGWERELGTVTKSQVSLADLPGYCHTDDGEDTTYANCLDEASNADSGSLGLRDVNQQLSPMVVQTQDDADDCRASVLDGDTSCAESTYSDDDDPSTFDPAKDLYDGFITVKAIDGQDRQTHAAVASLDGIRSSLPFSSAFHLNMAQNSFAVTDYFTGDSMNDEDLERSVTYYYSMLDGTTATGTISPDPNDIRKEGSLNLVAYTVAGTGMYGRLEVWGSDLSVEQAMANVQQAAQRVIASGKGGSVRVKRYFEDDKTFDAYDTSKPNSKPADELGVDEYHLFATTDYGRYVGANMLAGNTVIDVTQYASSPSAPQMTDVLGELSDQNIWFPNIAGERLKYLYRKDGGRYLLLVKYPDDWRKHNEEMLSQAKSIAAQVASAGDDKAKAAAIEQELARIGSYDEEASFDRVMSDSTTLGKLHPHAWYDGVLMGGAGVCTAYAYAFDAVADQAGLESYVVTGRASYGQGKGMGGHAWNRVRIDGQWFDTDPTWDDAGDHAVDTYQMKPANQLDQHVSDSDWLLDGYVGRYGGANES